jgi:hypothetical protein
MGEIMKNCAVALLISAATLAATPAVATTVTIDIPDIGSFQYFGSGTASVTYSGVTFSTTSSYSDGAFFNVSPGFSGASTPVVSSQQATFGYANILITLPEFASDITINYATFYGIPVSFKLSNGVTATQPSSATAYDAVDVYSSGPTSAFNWVQVLSSGKEYLSVGSITYTVAAVPEPASWAMMIAGFGLIGGALRRRPEVRVGYAA